MAANLLILGTLDARLRHHLAEGRHLHLAADGGRARRILRDEAIDLALLASEHHEGRGLAAEIRRRWPELAVLFVGLGGRNGPAPEVTPATLLSVVAVLQEFPPALVTREVEKVVSFGQVLARRSPMSFPEECSLRMEGVFPCLAWTFLQLGPPCSRLQQMASGPVSAAALQTLRERTLRLLADPDRDLQLHLSTWGGPTEEATEGVHLLAEALEHEGEVFGAIALCGAAAVLDCPLYRGLFRLLAAVVASSLAQDAEPPPEPEGLRELCAALAGVLEPGDVWLQLCRYLRATAGEALCGFACRHAEREVSAVVGGPAPAEDVLVFGAQLVESFREWEAQDASGADFSADRPVLAGAVALRVDGALLGLLSLAGAELDAEARAAIDICALAWESLLRRKQLEWLARGRKQLSQMRHEINNALTVIIGNTQLMRLGQVSEGDEELLRHVEECAIRVGDITAQLAGVFPPQGLLEVD